jgi:hypothetical protein
MKKYGLILADNGSPWYFGGEASPLWETDTGVISNFDQFQTDIRSIKVRGQSIRRSVALSFASQKALLASRPRVAGQ